MNTIAAPIVAHKQVFRVLVLECPGAKQRHERFDAVCVDFSVSARGHDTSEALALLGETLVELFKDEMAHMVPFSRKCPDADLVAAFEGDENRVGKEFRVAGRCELGFECEIKLSKSKRGSRQVTTQPLITCSPLAA
jgi:hypothetical protein